MSPRIVLDCDPGQDDAIAILCAARYGELVGITTVSGNVSLDKTTTNALLVCQLADLDVPVHAGAARPLSAEPAFADHVHGPTGLDGPLFPSLRRSTESDDAVGYLIDSAADDLWLVATGPLTNIALALEREPGLLDRFAGVTLMGGAIHGGNVTPAAEFNIWADPEAAAAVFASGAVLAMVSLDLTDQVRMGTVEAEELRRADTTTASMVADILNFYSSSTRTAVASGGAAMHDPCAVLHVTHPELFETTQRPVIVEVDGRHTRGMTVVDERLQPRSPEDEPTGPYNDRVDVAYRVDADRAIELIMDAARSPLA